MGENFEHRAYFSKIDMTIKKIRGAIQKRFTKSGIDFTVDQWVLMDKIYYNDGIGQNKLGELTLKDAPTVTRIIDILERKGYVKRGGSALDRRKYLIYLTETGREMYIASVPIIGEVRNIGWANLSDEDYEKLTWIMDTIYDNCHRSEF